LSFFQDLDREPRRTYYGDITYLQHVSCTLLIAHNSHHGFTIFIYLRNQINFESWISKQIKQCEQKILIFQKFWFWVLIPVSNFFGSGFKCNTGFQLFSVSVFQRFILVSEICFVTGFSNRYWSRFQAPIKNIIIDRATT